MLLETTRYAVLAVAVGLAILGAMAAPGLTASSAAAQSPSGNETATTTMPGSNETSSMQSSGNETATAPTTGNETASGPSITLKPASGGTGTNVTISGTGFSPGQTFRFTIDDKYILTGNMIQFATGEFSTTALIPADSTSGDHDIKAAGNAGENATATFTVEQGGGNATAGGNVTTTAVAAMSTLPPAPSLLSSNETLPAPPGNGTAMMPGNVTAPASGIGIASVVLTPATANRGSEVNIAGSGFGNGQNITLSIDGSSLNMNSTTITTDASGAFTVAFTIPANMTAGSHQVTAADSMGSKASAMLSITEAPTMPPSPPP